MRTTLWILAAPALAAAGCGSGSTSSAPPANTAIPTAAVAATATATASPVAGGKRPDGNGDGIPDAITVKGRTGDTLELQGSGLHDDPNNHAKTRIRVTLERVRGPFPGFDVAAGHEIVGVDLRVANVGALRYEDPQPDGQLALSGGQVAKQTSLITSGKSPCDNPSLKLATGQSRDVCVAFDVPKRGKRLSFQYTSDNGYGDTGFWRLR